MITAHISLVDGNRLLVRANIKEVIPEIIVNRRKILYFEHIAGPFDGQRLAHRKHPERKEMEPITQAIVNAKLAIASSLINRYISK